MVKTVFSRAPVRICDIGGWTDTWFFPDGAVFSFCVDLYSYVRILKNTTDRIKIVSENLNLTTEIKDFESIVYDGTLDLLKAAVKKMKIKEGLKIYVNAEAPPGSGTGTSASVAVALIAALAKYNKREMNPSEIASLAHKLEIEELQLESGVQDQYAAAFGGINFMKINYPSVKLTNIRIDEIKTYELEKRLISIFLGSRSSDIMHKAVIKKYSSGDKETIKSLETMKACAYEMKKAINLDLEDIGEIMYKNWEAQKNLHPLMVNNDIVKAERIAKNYGAIGFKCNGAGGGGSVSIIAAEGNEFKLKQELIKNGFKILPCKLCFNGVSSFLKE